jgi:hypothetical protein
VARASPFGLAQVEALAHLRHHIPPARIARTVASETVDACIPIATVRARFLSPQHHFKVFDAAKFGKLLFDSRVQRGYVD